MNSAMDKFNTFKFKSSVAMPQSPPWTNLTLQQLKYLSLCQISATDKINTLTVKALVTMSQSLQWRSLTL